MAHQLLHDLADALEEAQALLIETAGVMRHRGQSGARRSLAALLGSQAMRRLRKGVTKLHVVRDLLDGKMHNRHTVARLGVSLPTADRWLESIRLLVPGTSKFKDSKTTWYAWEPTRRMLKKHRGGSS